MKAKKALKRLTRVEELLADVLEGLAAIEQHARELLRSAKESVVRAKKAMKQKATPAGSKKRTVKGKRPVRIGPPMERGKKPARSATQRGVRAKAARTAAKKPTVKVRKPKRASLAAESKKRLALAARQRGVRAKAARATAKKATVKVRKPKRARLAAESKKQLALTAKKRPAKVRRPTAARNTQPHLAESPSPMSPFSSAPERQSDTVETNTAPLSATEGSEPVTQG